MIDAESEVFKIPKLGGGKSHSRNPNPKSLYRPPPPPGLKCLWLVKGFILDK